jgi:inner membrane transporter RhtA
MVVHSGAEPQGAKRVLPSLLALVASGSSNQLGASLGAEAFARVGPVGVVAVRQLVAAIALTSVARPRIRNLSRAQWWPVLVLAGIFGVMNLSLYEAISRIGLGTAITLEFLGPLVVALRGARSGRGVVCVLAVGVGVTVLVSPGPTTDWIGIGLALVAALCWAFYIYVNAVVGRRLPGLSGPALASCVSALAYLPALVLLIHDGRFDSLAWALCIATGILSSVIPYAIDVIVLRHLPAALFGIVMSLNPVLAAAFGLAVLDQRLTWFQWAAILLIVTANVVAVNSFPRVRREKLGPARESVSRA